MKAVNFGYRSMTGAATVELALVSLVLLTLLFATIELGYAASEYHRLTIRTQESGRFLSSYANASDAGDEFKNIINCSSCSVTQSRAVFLSSNDSASGTNCVVVQKVSVSGYEHKMTSGALTGLMKWSENLIRFRPIEVYIPMSVCG